MQISILKTLPEFHGKKIRFKGNLKGGITNKNYKIQVEEKKYAVRNMSLQTEPLRIDRQSEFGACELAWRQGVAPKPIAYLPEHHLMIFEFIEGTPIPPKIIKTFKYLVKIIKAIKKYHHAGQVPARFCVFETIESYKQKAMERGVPFPDYFPQVERKIKTLKKKVASLDKPEFQNKLCHNDLLNANFLKKKSDKKIMILDWEYAGMGNLFFDLANFSSHHELNNRQDLEMLTLYFDGQVSSRTLELLNHMKLLSLAREAMWGLLQCGLSELNFDYRNYTRIFFKRFLESQK